MKIIGAENIPTNAGEDFGWFLIADSAITNTGKPFYLPENYGKTEARLAWAVKISRLGKHVSKKFAPRYYSEFALALNFWFPDFEAKLQAEGLPADAARNFDRALFVGEFHPLAQTLAETNALGGEIELLKNGVSVVSIQIGSQLEGVNEMIEKVSDINTLKIGDILLPHLGKGVAVEEGDLLEIKGPADMGFKIRVK